MIDDICIQTIIDKYFKQSNVLTNHQIESYDITTVRASVGMYILSKWISKNKLILFDDNYSALNNADALLIITEWKMFRNPSIKNMKKLMKELCIFDGRNQYDPQYMKKNGFMYKGIGR